MAATPESKVKAKVVAQLKELGAYWFTPVTGGFGKSGVPDIVGVLDSTFFGIECKAGGNKPTKLQMMNLQQIKGAGGIALVIDETTVWAVVSYLTTKTSNV